MSGQGARYFVAAFKVVDRKRLVHVETGSLLDGFASFQAHFGLVAAGPGLVRKLVGGCEKARAEYFVHSNRLILIREESFLKAQDGRSDLFGPRA